MSDLLPEMADCPYRNGFATRRYKALLAALRSLPLDATELEIVTRADSLLYYRSGIFADEKGNYVKDLKHVKEYHE